MTKHRTKVNAAHLPTTKPDPRLLLALVLSALLAAALPAAAQNAGDDGSGAIPSAPRVLEAVQLRGDAPTIDGDLSDPVWSEAPAAGEFIQVEPREGAPATERTEVRVVYDAEALYVAMRAFDSDPAGIAAQLTRRGEISSSDMLHVVIDSYADRRTAFHFAVNPVGVKYDAYRYNDYLEDSDWQAVWDVATQRDSLGWSAEFRIPLSQLRFSGEPNGSWGVNFGRDIARKNELSTWSPMSNREEAFVSRFGRLEGVDSIRPPSRLEVLPYSAGSLTREPGEPGDPYWRRNAGDLEVGADLRMGVMRNLTLDLTVNPDFGQVEADPAQVNLSAFETFLPERRPFFQEGAGIFRFGIGLGDGDGANEQLFYSRRIGRAPQGDVPGSPDWVDRSSRTRILGAGKLSGRPGGGWSVGVLNALTAEEHASATTGTEEARHEIEPMTSYSVARAQRDFRDGESTLGAIGTMTLRDGATADELGLRREAYTGGVDLRHRFRRGTMEIRAYLLGSRVAGSSGAIEDTQRSSARYLQRPDASHLELDPTATSMQGWSGTFELWKRSGGPWQFASLTQARSPGFEVNDLGFMPRSDFVTQAAWMGYLHNEPGEHLQRWDIGVNAWADWTFGGEFGGPGGNVNGSLLTNGNLRLNGGIALNARGLDTRLLRGGPAVRSERVWSGWGGMRTDSRRDLQVGLNGSWMYRGESDSWSVSASPDLRWRPADNVIVRGGPSFTRRFEDRQWIDRIDADGGPEYVFGRMEQSTLGLNLRADVAVTPTLSFQLYAQPFMSSGSFESFSRVVEPRADRYTDRFQPVAATRQGDEYVADLNGDGAAESFENPNFDVLQFRSNAVLRWEYRPGSTLYLVWAQGRDRQNDEGRFRVGHGFDRLFSGPTENVFMVKVSYWLNP